ncbi:MAG: class I mannose-6-phosphate isomerase [Candidatus Sumerlaeia bacterium]|nr:class I mannose-6-phosphate isomerase [Candidatus Sumerlaeia bacterium]
MATKSELKTLLKAPIELARNTYLHFYNGGKLRAAFVGEKNPKDDFRSEEWIFSTNRTLTPGRPNPPTKGISRIKLPGGKRVLITELLEKFPDETLGAEHVAKFGPKLGILVKIFDVGDNAHIPVHWHPSPEFSSKHLNSPYGKNEAWVVVGTRPGAKAWIGFKHDVSKEQFRQWMEAQDVATMRKHMWEVRPKVGDVIFLRDSKVHSLGSGLCILEPQEPTDWNILAEWKGYPYKREDGACGLDWDTALEAAEFSAMPKDYLENYVMRKPVVYREEAGGVEYDLVPEEARKYFWLRRVIVKDTLAMPNDRGFYCVIGINGEGELRGPWGAKKIRRGRSYFIPRCLPAYDIVNVGKKPLEVVCCYPPAVK